MLAGGAASSAGSDLTTFGGRLSVLGPPMTTGRVWVWRVSAGKFHQRREEAGLLELGGTQWMNHRSLGQASWS